MNIIAAVAGSIALLLYGWWPELTAMVPSRKAAKLTVDELLSLASRLEEAGKTELANQLRGLPIDTFKGDE